MESIAFGKNRYLTQGKRKRYLTLEVLHNKKQLLCQ